jgi:hypothetical protein
MIGKLIELFPMNSMTAISDNLMLAVLELRHSRMGNGSKLLITLACQPQHRAFYVLQTRGKILLIAERPINK